MTSVQDLDGAKMLFGDSAWLMVRASGTENLLRLYSEAPSREQVKILLEEMTRIAKGIYKARLCGSAAFPSASLMVKILFRLSLYKQRHRGEPAFC